MGYSPASVIRGAGLGQRRVRRFTDWPAMLGLMAIALIAVACAGFMVANGAANVLATAGAILVLASGQIALIIVTTWYFGKLRERLSQQSDTLQAQADLAVQRDDAINARLDEIEHRLAHPQPGRLEEVTAELRALRDSIRTHVAEPAPQSKPQHEIKPQPAAEPERATGSERLDLLLEPMIELSTGTTGHYRAQLALGGEQGQSVAHRELMEKAERGGMRPALDLHLLRQVAPILRRLRVKQPGVRIFVPIGASTLASRADLARLTGLLQQEADVASGLVFDFDQSILGGLDTTGIESFAELSRLGATMALSNVAVSGLDLAALRQLGVRFLGIGAQAFDAGFGMSPAWRDFAQYARAMQFQIVASDVATAQQATAATHIARFGNGPFFAPPRKVKGDAGTAAAQQRSQAA